MAILVKVPGSSLGKLFILDFFYFKFKKIRHEEHKGHAMIVMCDKKCQTAIFGQRRRNQTTTALSIPKAIYRGRFVIPDGSEEGVILVR